MMSSRSSSQRTSSRILGRGLSGLALMSAFSGLATSPVASAAATDVQKAPTGQRVLIDDNKSGGSVSEIVGKWMAAGSGCMGTSQEKGNVALAESSWNGKGRQHLALAFAVSGYSLRPLEKSANGAEPNKLHYARECAIRFSVNPPKGMRLATVTSRTTATLSKDAQADLLINAILKVGSASVAEERRSFDKSLSFQNRDELLDLIPGRSPELDMPALSCEESKVVGADLTFLTKKSAASDLAEAKLARGEQVSFDLSFVPCTPAP